MEWQSAFGLNGGDYNQGTVRSFEVRKGSPDATAATKDVDVKDALVLGLGGVLKSSDDHDSSTVDPSVDATYEYEEGRTALKEVKTTSDQELRST
jgi:hypothetical protein